MWLSLLLFSCVCGIFGEGIEILRLRYAGIALAGLDLRLTLAVAYALLAAALYLGASLFGVGWRTRIAAMMFAVAVFVPWANFEFLPAAGSAKSLFGSVLVALVSGGVGWTVARIPRIAAAAVFVLGIVANVEWTDASGRPVATAVKRPTADAPNLVVILIDTLRADHLGVYGYDRPTSPRIDAIARNSVVFNRAVAQAAWTKPSVASLFTGRFVHNHGVIRSRDTLGTDMPTIATLVSGAGYRTAGFSSNPWITPEFRFDRGFDEFESGRAMGPQLTNLYRTIRRVERLLKRFGLRPPIASSVFGWAGRSNSGNAERDEQLVASVVEWLAGAGDRNPFFIYVHLIGPHDPYDPPQRFADAFARSREPAPHLPPPRVQTIFERAEAMPDAARDRMVDQYDGAIAHADYLVGRIDDQLHRLGLVDDTILVIVSDHGEEFYEHGNWRHGNQLYDEVVRVPMLVRLPGGQATVRRDPAMLVDLLPTVVDLLGVPVAAEGLGAIDGRPLFPAPAAFDQSTFSEHWWFQGGTYVSQAAARNGFKLTSTRDEAGGRQREELYDLRRDPGERNDMSGSAEARDEEIVGLRTVLADLADDGVAEAGGKVRKIDSETAERLRALGYLGDARRN